DWASLALLGALGSALVTWPRLADLAARSDVGSTVGANGHSRDSLYSDTRHRLQLYPRRRNGGSAGAGPIWLQLGATQTLSRRDSNQLASATSALYRPNALRSRGRGGNPPL